MSAPGRRREPTRQAPTLAETGEALRSVAKAPPTVRIESRDVVVDEPVPRLVLTEARRIRLEGQP